MDKAFQDTTHLSAVKTEYSYSKEEVVVPLTFQFTNQFPGPAQVTGCFREKTNKISKDNLSLINT